MSNLADVVFPFKAKKCPSKQENLQIIKYKVCHLNRSVYADTVQLIFTSLDISVHPHVPQHYISSFCSLSHLTRKWRRIYGDHENSTCFSLVLGLLQRITNFLFPPVFLYMANLKLSSCTIAPFPQHARRHAVDTKHTHTHRWSFAYWSVSVYLWVWLRNRQPFCTQWTVTVNVQKLAVSGPTCLKQFECFRSELYCKFICTNIVSLDRKKRM